MHKSTANTWLSWSLSLLIVGATVASGCNDRSLGETKLDAAATATGGANPGGAFPGTGGAPAGTGGIAGFAGGGAAGQGGAPGTGGAPAGTGGTAGAGPFGGTGGQGGAPGT